ncbi:MAG: hypothetical protein BHW65_08700 [Verrucomicrobia bacterium CAG:312_58_20]|nr:MAG: hypothetical protein BHW65_08700 [Verrucomicrobia bacterium CAG:312_58_20]PWL67362.1 MAG: hypothetical protein DBY30_04210 [Verrucomicrobiota bacterium]
MGRSARNRLQRGLRARNARRPKCQNIFSAGNFFGKLSALRDYPESPAQSGAWEGEMRGAEIFPV